MSAVSRDNQINALQTKQSELDAGFRRSAPGRRDQTEPWRRRVTENTHGRSNQYFYCLSQMNEVSGAQSISAFAQQDYFTVHANQYCNQSCRMVGTVNERQILGPAPYFKACQLGFEDFFFFLSLSDSRRVPRRRNFSAAAFDSLPRCAVLFIFYHNDRLQPGLVFVV